MVHDHDNAISYERPAVQWFVFLAGPAAWSAQLLLSYFLISVVCGAVSSLVIAILLHLASAIPLLITALAGVVAIRILRTRQQEATAFTEDTDDRSGFMGAASTLNSLLFLLAIGFSWIGVFLVSPCA